MQTNILVVNVLHLTGRLSWIATKISAAGALNHHCVT